MKFPGADQCSFRVEHIFRFVYLGCNRRRKNIRRHTHRCRRLGGCRCWRMLGCRRCHKGWTFRDRDRRLEIFQRFIVNFSIIFILYEPEHVSGETQLPVTKSRTNPCLQKHPRTHWSVQNIGVLLTVSQVNGQAVPHNWNSSFSPEHFVDAAAKFMFTSSRSRETKIDFANADISRNLTYRFEAYGG